MQLHFLLKHVSVNVSKTSCVFVAVGGSRHCKRDGVRPRRANYSLWTTHSCRLLCVCMCEMLSLPLPFPESNSDPHMEQNSYKIPLSCRFTRWTSVIVVAGLSSIHLSGVSVPVKQNKKHRRKKGEEFPFFVVKVLFTWCRLGYKEQKRGSLTFGRLSTRCSTLMMLNGFFISCSYINMHQQTTCHLIYYYC